ncbi:hypothetical protein H5410_035410 [Solanum commersonii]|uniref:Uncharacterized protein n=1 Tax=Solanum commersonii TaxID=4109 RepID=A0A9J5Y2L2_SOLCO|nr:hypothetical protein H5410_035410 [Solanum commersonii]
MLWTLNGVRHTNSVIGHNDGGIRHNRGGVQHNDSEIQHIGAIDENKEELKPPTSLHKLTVNSPYSYRQIHHRHCLIFDQIEFERIIASCCHRDKAFCRYFNRRNTAHQCNVTPTLRPSDFDITFPAISSSILSVDAMDISGEQHLDIVCAANRHMAYIMDTNEEERVKVNSEHSLTEAIA